MGAYCALSGEDRRTFLRLLGSVSRADVPFFVADGLRTSEQIQLSRMFVERFVPNAMPLLARAALDEIECRPGASSDELVPRIIDRASAAFRVITEAVEKAEQEKIKAQRDRKSSPDIIRRNIQIIERRRQNPNLWTLGRLAKEYEIERQTIQGILDEELKWRQLEAGLFGN